MPFQNIPRTLDLKCVGRVNIIWGRLAHCYYCAPKQKDRHFDEDFATGCTVILTPSIVCSQWRKSRTYYIHISFCLLLIALKRNWWRLLAYFVILTTHSQGELQNAFELCYKHTHIKYCSNLHIRIKCSLRLFTSSRVRYEEAETKKI